MLRFILVLSGTLGIYSSGVLAQNSLGNYETKLDKSASIFMIEKFETGLGGAPAGSARPVSALALDLIATFEGLEKLPYNDSAGYCTIGYGHLIAKARCTDKIVGEFKGGISAREAKDLLMLDAAQAGQAAIDLSQVSLSDGQHGALTSFVFNFGATKYADSTLLKRVRAKQHEAAAEQFLRWVKARNPETGKLEKLRGLVARRNCEASLYMEVLSSPFDRALCEEAFGAAPLDWPLIDVSVGE